MRLGQRGGILLSLLATTTSYAGAYTAWATPTQIDVVTNQGFMVYGSFGNPNGCTVADQFFVYASDTQYRQAYAQILAALTANRQIKVYVTECDPISWYSVASTTYSALTDSSAIQIK
ncbi:MAG TPA: hypothetical protein VJQ82_06590 [Terriglobales bacterium]|nr:hypothetical protein [Terriglobales bacterium]